VVITTLNSEIRTQAAAAARPQLRFLIMAYFFSSVLSEGGQLFNVSNPSPADAYFVLASGLGSLLLYFVISASLNKGYANSMLKIVDGQRAVVSDLFNVGRDFWRSFAAVLVVFIKTLLWFLLFIFPAFIAYYKYILTFYVLNERSDLSGAQCVRESARLMKGNKAKLFRLLIIYVLMAAAVSIVSYFLFLGIIKLTLPNVIESNVENVASVISVTLAGVMYGIKANPAIAKFYRLVSAGE
jgi:uncharacterized membrane protein